MTFFFMCGPKYLLVFIICEGVNFSTGNDKETCDSKKSKLFIIPDNYEFDQIPLVESGTKPFAFTVDMDVWDITDLSLEKQDIGVDLILTISWADPRLSVHPNITSPRLWHVVNKQESRLLWRPTMFYRNCVGCQPITLDSSLMSDLYMKKSDGEFWVQHRSLTRFRCSIDLRSYPMDQQSCSVQLYTNAEYIDALVIEHYKQEGQTSISSNMTLSEFIISSMKQTKCDFYDGNDTMSCIEIQIHFVRLLSYHLMTSYIPTAFIVVISWISFWIPVEVVPARIALGLTLLLTMATRLDQAQKNLPSVSYVKAIDLWMFACICMVCCSLLEFATSYYIWRVYQTDGDAITFNVSAQQVRPVPVETISHPPFKQQEKQRDGTSLDRASRAVFPLLFILFNLFYWTYYL